MSLGSPREKIGELTYHTQSLSPALIFPIAGLLTPDRHFFCPQIVRGQAASLVAVAIMSDRTPLLGELKPVSFLRPLTSNVHRPPSTVHRPPAQIMTSSHNAIICSTASSWGGGGNDQLTRPQCNSPTVDIWA